MSNIAFKTIFRQLGIQDSGAVKSNLMQEIEGPLKEGKKNASFSSYLAESLREVNAQQKTADKMATEVATGKSESIHETMLALSHAELSFKMMVQIRNKALEAYQDIMRMQV